ncbi:ABC transporter ATP-binding protein [Pseudomonas typographi]|uniref:ABC transporter ATP-binding protein n=1 Tax=Pseudomonas typographi TaxID=2715964 RepID=UPI0016829F1D|nr:oligopeptide/dipeptide ABC transporter ATP-binding protein [Pseudomonas typographi]MBD1587531.1 ATP-binding cassette domain-containing protein [Pseudomonas typographi]
MSAFISITDVHKVYRVGAGMLRRGQALQAVRGVSLAVAKGATYGLVGESGSGKSTLAKVVMGAERPSAGTVHIDGRLMDGRASALSWLRTCLQPVLQDPYGSLNPTFCVRQLVDEPLRIHHKGLSARELTLRVNTLLAQVGLPTHLALRHPRELSGGQKQRVAIARALALSPQCLVLDEPVSALDVSVQAQVLNLLDDMQAERGLTYLLISHDLAVVAHMSDHVGVMYLGALQEQGPVEQVLAAPRHPYTRALIAAAEPVRGRLAEPLQGEVPSPLAPPSGCVFHPRCPAASARCRREAPPLRQVARGHWAACHNA